MKLAGRFLKVWIDDASGTPRDVSADIESVEIPEGYGELDMTGMGQGGEDAAPGMPGFPVEMVGMFNPAATTGLFTVLSGIIGQYASKTVTIQVGNNAAPTATDPIFEGEFWLQKMSPGAVVKGKKALKASFKPMGGTAPSWWTTVSAPATWSRSLPFTVQRNCRVFRASPATWSIGMNKPVGKAYYVSMTGSDSNDGLTAATPLRRVSTAINKADVVMIYVEAGVYDFDNSWATIVAAKNLSIIATGGRAVFSARYAGLAWANVGSDTYSTSRTNVAWVYDANAELREANGLYKKLAAAASLAECQATAGSFYYATPILYVHLSDGRAPDGDCLVMIGAVSVSMNVFRGAYTLYCEGIDFEGGYNNAMSIYYNGGAPTGYFADCTFRYSANDNGLGASGAQLYLQDCVAEGNYNDGFTYGLLTVNSHAVEIDCVGRYNGESGDINNGSTIHYGSVVRLNGEYHDNVGRNIHDVNTGVQSWNLGCYAHDSASEVNDCNYAVGTGGTGGEMWLDSVTSDGSTTDLEENSGATLLYRNLISDGVFLGTPAEY
jgi:hypothetical protein